MAGLASKFTSDRAAISRSSRRWSQRRWCSGSGWRSTASTIASRQNALQQAINSAVLAVAREGKDVSDEKAAAIAHQFLDANFDPNSTKFKVVKNGTEFSVKAQTTAGLAFGTLFGYEDWPVMAAATADIAYASYEIALVLDTTGSMKGGKLTSMKDAVLGLIDTMSMQVNDEAQAEIRDGSVRGLRQCRTRNTVRRSTRARASRSPAAAPPGSTSRAVSTIPQSRARRRREPLPALPEPRSRTGRAAWRRATPPTRITTSTTRRPIRRTSETLFVPAFAIDEPDTPDFSEQLHPFGRQAERQEPGREEEALGQIRRGDRRGRQAAERRPDRARSPRWSSTCSADGRQITASTPPAHPRSPASKKGPGPAATSSRSRRSPATTRGSRRR